MSDGQLRSLFQKFLPQFHWQSVETWSTGQGVPDVNYCHGVEGWIEFKLTATWRVDVRPEQVGWIERRLRAGGNVHIAVRRKHSGGPNKGAAVDELWLFPGSAARGLLKGSIREMDSFFWSGGPSRWDWKAVADNLMKSQSKKV